MTLGNKMKLTAPDKIREIRQRKGMSQEDMAAKIGILQSTYNKIECGKIKLKFDDALRICQILKVSIEEIIPGEGDVIVSGNSNLRLKEIVGLLEREIEYLEKIKNNILEL